MVRWCATIIWGIILAAAPGVALSASPERIGNYRSWVALEQRTTAGKVCYMYAEPRSMKGRYTKRGEVYAEILHAPAEGRRNEVLFVAGYTFKKNSTVKIDIDGRKFALFTDKGLAWTAGPDEDRALVRAMRNGRRMVVRGRSTRGTLTTDTYSLMGFTDAYRKVSRACNLKTG